jgi:hypothetical protein
MQPIHRLTTESPLHDIRSCFSRLHTRGQGRTCFMDNETTKELQTAHKKTVSISWRNRYPSAVWLAIGDKSDDFMGTLLTPTELATLIEMLRAAEKDFE